MAGKARENRNATGLGRLGNPTVPALIGDGHDVHRMVLLDSCAGSYGMQLRGELAYTSDRSCTATTHA